MPDDGRSCYDFHLFALSVRTARARRRAFSSVRGAKAGPCPVAGERLAAILDVHAKDGLVLSGGTLSPVPRPERLVDSVVSTLREEILNGRLSPGTVLLQEDLASQLGVSRTPLREGLRVLEHDGLIRTESNKRSVVVALSTDDIRELLEMRLVLDAMASRLAAGRPQPASVISELVAQADQLIGFSDPLDNAGFLRANTEFHLAVLAASGNKRLQRFAPEVRISTQMLYPLIERDPERMSQSASEHHAIAEAIGGGQADLAESLAREHIARTLAAWVS